jgi:hypothetical protein
MCTFIGRFLMNGDEVVRNVPYTLVPSEFPILGRVNRAYRFDTCDCFDVQFALLTVNEFRRACQNCEFLGEILNMY